MRGPTPPWPLPLCRIATRPRWRARRQESPWRCTLEGEFALVLANAQRVKALDGEKTDAKDSAWIADLIQHGLLRGSFVPAQEQRDCRDPTRLRTELVQDSNRVPGVNERVA